MYTIDEMIERLKELREISPDGGKTPVLIRLVGDDLEPAAAELQKVYKFSDRDVWDPDGIPNATVLTIF